MRNKMYVFYILLPYWVMCYQLVEEILDLRRYKHHQGNLSTVA